MYENDYELKETFESFDKARETCLAPENGYGGFVVSGGEVFYRPQCGYLLDRDKFRVDETEDKTLYIVSSVLILSIRQSLSWPVLNFRLILYVIYVHTNSVCHVRISVTVQRPTAISIPVTRH